MGAGAMDQRITLQRATALSDGAGGVTWVWADLPVNASVWAAVKSRVWREALTEGRVAASYVMTFTIYNRSDLSEVDRIVWNGENYNIRGISRNGGAAITLSIDAERGVA